MHALLQLQNIKSGEGFLVGIFDFLNPRSSSTPAVPSVLPDVAKQKIMCGQLPVLQPNNLLLKNGEICHYADRAIYEKRIVNQKRIRKNMGYSMPGLFKGTRVHMNGGNSKCVDDVAYSMIKGFLYITTARIIFVADSEGFNRKIEDLVAVTPYANCVEFQFNNETFKLFVPNGNFPHTVLKLI